MKKLLSALTLMAAAISSFGAPYPFISTNNNCIYINPNGLDAAGVKGRYDLPFKSIDAAKAIGAVGDTFVLSSGNHNFTNVWVMKNGQSIIGQGPDSTFLTYAGFNPSGGVNLWVGIELATNVCVSGFSISATNWGTIKYAACIGSSFGGAGCSNAVVRDVWMYGDTDCFYCDNGYVNATLINCRFRSAWDTVVFNGGGPDSVLNLVNCTSINIAPSVNTDQDLGRGALCFRQSRTRSFFNIVGGDYFSTGELGEIAAGTMNFSGAPRLACSNPTNKWFITFGGPCLYNFADTIIDPIHFSQTDNNHRSSGPMWFPRLSTSPAPIGSYGSTLESSNFFPRVSTGQTYWNSNLFQMRIFNGMEWQALTPALNTNKIVVTGEPNPLYNGVYTYKTGTLDGMPGIVWTNWNGKFFLFSTNEFAGDVFQIMDTESQFDTPIDGGGRLADPPAIVYNFGRLTTFTPNAQFEFAEKDTLDNTTLVIGTAYTNQTSRAQTVVGLSAILTAAAVTGVVAVNVEISTVRTNTVLSFRTTAAVITGTDTFALPTIRVPSGCRFKFLDSSTGAGNSATLTGGQVF